MSRIRTRIIKTSIQYTIIFECEYNEKFCKTNILSRNIPIYHIEKSFPPRFLAIHLREAETRKYNTLIISRMILFGKTQVFGWKIIYILGQNHAELFEKSPA